MVWNIPSPCSRSVPRGAPSTDTEVAGHADSKPLPSWSGDVRALEGKVVRLKFVLEDADLYAYQFVGWQNDPAYSVTAADIGPDRAWGRGNEREQ